MNEELMAEQRRLVAICQKLSNEIAALITASEEGFAHRAALTLVLHQVVRCTPNRDEVLNCIERVAAQMQLQPGVLLDNQELFHRMKMHLDSMTANLE